ncbi:MAG: hypothetical protein KDJ41_15775 [Hyphomicrobiaceae bacterium]|nr:hypothetical protein [Hyphomicrobiaceae bacterium]
MRKLVVAFAVVLLALLAAPLAADRAEAASVPPASALELFQIKPLAEPARCYRRCYRRLVRRCHWRGGRKYCGRWHSRGVYCRRRCY